MLWRRTHGKLGIAFMIAGLVTIATGIVAPSFGLVVAIGSMLAGLVVSMCRHRARTQNAASPKRVD
jgi:Kef-type K+ transport system membrane component KefB